MFALKMNLSALLFALRVQPLVVHVQMRDSKMNVERVGSFAGGPNVMIVVAPLLPLPRLPGLHHLLPRQRRLLVLGHASLKVCPVATFL
jgi:hypothetical protein